MTDTAGIPGDRIRSFIERVERIDEEIKALNEGKKDVFAEAKGEGFEVKVLREILRLRKQDKDERDEQEFCSTCISEPWRAPGHRKRRRPSAKPATDLWFYERGLFSPDSIRGAGRGAAPACPERSAPPLTPNLTPQQGVPFGRPSLDGLWRGEGDRPAARGPRLTTRPRPISRPVFARLFFACSDLITAVNCLFRSC